MTDLLVSNYMERRPLFALLLIAIIAAASSCGRIAPVHEPGQIQVSSTPAGAAILIDGQDTGQITPATISNLPPGNYVVTVHMDSYITSPPESDVELSELEVVPAEFTLSQLGQLVIGSQPEGAAIWIDGSDTGQITPAVVDGITPGTVTISLLHPEVHFSPQEISAEIVSGEQTEVLAAAFTSRSRRTVLFEGFSNVNCGGCPEMAQDIHALMGEPNYSLDRVIYIKYSMDWPNPTDPHYRHNPDENMARRDVDYDPLYSGFNIPALIVDGTMAGTGGTPPELEGMRSLVDAGTATADPGFLIDISADLSGFSVPTTVTLSAASDIDLTGYSLHVALVQSEVHYDSPPGSGETEFHWVFRDKANTTPALGPFSAGSAQQFSLNLNRDDWDIPTVQVIAFVQHNTTLEIPQAGSTMVTTTTGPASIFLNDENTNPNNTPGGNHP